MANTTTSPNMNLPVPVPGTDPGPDWATNIVADMYAIDSHNHTPGQGVPITPSGIDVNTDLSMGDNNLTDVRSVNFTAQSAPLAGATDLGCVYVSGVDLYYNDENGNQVRITQAGSVTGSTGTITGLPSGTASASYSGGTFTFQSATNTPATMAVGPLVIGRVAASSKTVTLSPNAAQATDFNMTLPLANPANDAPLSVSSTGTITPGLAAGSASNPSMSFASDLDTGLYNPSANTLAASLGGTNAMTLSSTGLTILGDFRGPGGDISAPTYSFSGDTDTGIYNFSPNVLGVVTAGTDSARFASRGIILSQSGSAATPPISFSDDLDTGIYNISANTLGLTVGGTLSTTISTAGMTVVGNISTTAFKAIGGDATTPTHSFISDSDTGIYDYSPNVLGVTAGGVDSAQFSSTGATVSGTLAVAGNTTVGGSLNIASGGAFKVAIFSGTISGSTTINLPAPGSGTVLGACGHAQNGLGSVAIPVGTVSGVDVYFDNSTGSVIASRIVNSSGSSRTYKVTMFYN